MAYKRIVTPPKLLSGEELTAAMIGIGLGFAGKSSKESNIEDTLLAASFEGMEHDDPHLLAVLITWLEVHHSWINADRLLRIVRSQEVPRVRAFWAAVGQWLHKDRRLARLAHVYSGPRVALLATGTDFQIRRRGEDPRFDGTHLRVPAGVLRNRVSDVFQPTELAKRHTTYQYRILMGPTYRADMWAAFELDPSLSPSELARCTYGSFATAWQVRNDWQLLKAV